MTDCLRVITENTAKYAGGGYVKDRWISIVGKKRAVSNKSGAQIVADVIKKTGLRLESSGGEMDGPI